MSKPGHPSTPLKILLIGYGKMGKAIEEIALQRGHSIVLRVDHENPGELNKANCSKANVAIEFTNPESAYGNVRKCLENQLPVVCGTTGWTSQLDEMKGLAVKTGTGFIYSSNFSVGVNIFFEVNKKLAALMAPHPDYEVILEEIHHTQKKDAPSGTAISLAEQILEHIKRKKKWVNELSDHPEDLEIISQRIDTTPGTHSIRYSSAIDNIEIIHTAHNRKGFAAGAVLAAEFIIGKEGFYSMQDVLGL